MTIYVVGRYTLKNEGTIILIKLQIMINFLRVEPWWLEEQYSYKKLLPILNTGCLILKRKILDGSEA